ncbi:FAD-dependent oxidoreductase [Jannaschia pohangensis]|uniref:2-polyprenyl-6-methoxyphenol hydroxylase n=1 Tax=Jannaschia pohangensis TaxID=390807 RepID=A0A1I3M5X1_9RHOB|nr:NAD(P)/FAD-dependent oxidoreductase [Jannaschia pohangensis]SFI92401.1 2-polyprenyl-6-methoxyphenol hydroxylase [Jannaschia pohangensis]
MARIAIAGAGIGGLAAGAGLARDGHDVTVFDRYEAHLPVGSGLVVQPVGLGVLDGLGVGDAARGLGQTLRRMAGHEAESGRPVLDVTYDPKGRGREGLAMHRAALHHVLLTAAERQQVRFELAAEITGREGTRLRLTSGLTEAFDLIVDSAGAGSVLSPLRARALPYGAIWGNVPWPDATSLPTDELRQCYRRADRMIGVLPIGRRPDGGPRLAALFWSMPRGAFEDWRATPLDQWKAEARALWPEVAPFLDGVAHHDDMTMARYSHGTLRKPFDDGIVHIGDAWHRASPQLGQGANMALLDAEALVRAVADGPLAEAGARMRNARRLHVTTYQMMSAAFTPQYQSDSRILPMVRDRLLFPVAQVWPARSILPPLARGQMVPPILGGL